MTCPLRQAVAHLGVWDLPQLLEEAAKHIEQSCSKNDAVVLALRHRAKLAAAAMARCEAP